MLLFTSLTSSRLFKTTGFEFFLDIVGRQSNSTCPGLVTIIAVDNLIGDFLEAGKARQNLVGLLLVKLLVETWRIKKTAKVKAQRVEPVKF